MGEKVGILEVCMKKFFGLFFVAALAASGLFLSCSDESESLVYIPALQDSDYTVTADADSIVETINNMPKSGTIKTSGEFYLILIGKVINALRNLPYRKPNILVTLDLSAVTGWTDLSFSGCKNLAGIVLPTSVKGIGDSAFRGCTKLASVKIPNSVISIGDSAFYGCSSLTSVTIPNSVTSISDSAFYDCSSLTSVMIPSSVISIGNWAFRGCSSLASVTIADGVTGIGISAFERCRSLASVTIPSSVTTIGRYAFYITGLQNTTFSDANNWYYTTNSIYTGGYAIDSESLANPSTAAQYLKSAYWDYYWYKN